MEPLLNPPIPNLNITTNPESVESSPRSNAVDAFMERLPSVPGPKLRLLCSFGGHIIPRPHDKSLCYIGGETRLIVVDRNSSLSAFTSRLAKTLVNGRPFTLKYQLPNEDLDSLVSVATEEDLENMIEEYDRIAPSRIRLFLFFNKPETVASMGSLLADAKSESWFVDVLNGSGLIPRNLSDTATVDCLVNLDADDHDLEAQVNGTEVAEEEKTKANNVMQPDMNSTIPEQTLVENNSSYGSSSSSPSMSNLPPIRVRAEETKSGIEEEFAQMTFAQVVQQKQDGFSHLNIPLPPMPTAIAGNGTVTPISPAGSVEHVNQMLSDDDRSDKGAPVAFRKPPRPLLPLQVAPKLGTYYYNPTPYYNLPSPDSVGSDTSISSATSHSKPGHYQEQDQVAPGDSKGATDHDTRGDNTIQSSQTHAQRVQDPGYAFPPHLDQNQQQKQHFVQASTLFIPQYAPNGVPVSPYLPFYAAPPPQQLRHPTDHQQYPVYVMPIPQTQQPYMSMQPNLIDATSVVASSQPPRTAAPTNMAAAAAVPISATYKDSHTPLYPPNAAVATAAKADLAGTAYKTAVQSTPQPQVYQIPASQFQQQYTGYTQMPHPTQLTPVAPRTAATETNYAYEYPNHGHESHDQGYYPQHQHQANSVAATLPPQYQSMTPAAAAALADASKEQHQPTNNAAQ